MNKGNNIPIANSEEKSFPFDKQNAADNGNNVPNNGIKYTFKSSAISKKENGRTIALKKDLEYLKDPNYTIQTAQDVGKNFKRIFDKYDLTYDELGELVGISGKTLEHYINGYPCKEGDSPHSAASSKKDKEKTVYKKSGKVDVVTLIKCAEVFSNIPDKEGNYHRISLDHLTGLTAFSSVDNELIHDQLGLSDSAIEALKRYNKIDSDNEDDLEAFKKQLEKDPGAHHNMFMWYMPIINFMLSNKHLKAFLERFHVMNSDLYQVPVYKDKKGFKTFPSYLSDNEDYLYFGLAPNCPDDNVGIRIDSDFRYEINKNLISRSIDSMAADYKKRLEKNIKIIETDSK